MCGAKPIIISRYRSYGLVLAAVLAFFGVSATFNCFAQSAPTSTVSSSNKFFPSAEALNTQAVLTKKAAIKQVVTAQTNIITPPNISYQTPQVYTTNTTITPLQPTNTGGAVPATIYGQVITFAGSTTAGYVDAVGTAARFYSPTRLSQDFGGNLLVADRDNRVIRKISTVGVVSTVATGFSQINGTAVDNAGNLYAADAQTNIVSLVSPLGVVTPFAMGFNYPLSLAVDASQNIIVADSRNNQIKKITPTGSISTLAGNGSASFANGQGTAASFNNCAGVNTDILGNVYVADASNNRIRKIDATGLVTTVAGTGAASSINGPATSATFNVPAGVAAGLGGEVYVAEIAGNVIRRIDASGNVTTVAGSSTAGATDGIGAAAAFKQPNDVQYSVGGFLYVTDYGNNEIRKVIVTGYTIDKPLPAGLSFDPTTGIISGTPTITSPPTIYTITAYNIGGSSTTTVSIEVVTGLLPSIINFPTLPQNTGSNFLTPAATSTNNETPVTYTSSNTAVAVITSNGQVQIVGRGVTTITASQAGDSHYTAATPVSQIMTVTETVSIHFPAIAVKQTCNADFFANATINDTSVPLTFSSSDPTVATISSTGIIHILKAGTTTITAAVTGVQYVQNASVTENLIVDPPTTLTVQINASASTICVGMSVTFTMAPSAQGAVFPANTQFQWTRNGAAVTSNPNGTYTTSTLAANDVITCVATPPSASCFTPVTASLTYTMVTQYQTPSVVIASSASGPVCPGVAITFTATPTNGGTSPIYQWLVNGTIVSATGPQFTTTSLSDGDLVTCNLTNQGGACLTTLFAQSNSIAAQIITPLVPPSVLITSSTNSVYYGTSVTFTAATSNAGSNVDTSGRSMAATLVLIYRLLPPIASIMPIR